ncbi:swi snf family dna-dependent atpase ris1 [Diplodia corticola]|uniref:Swi snf family dna-dependent atpase ris1 n=1 Tax=Diplodia corticola TaxID=236234 RepID=A0A1J9RU67_9PEZI|nr:swi snf family dna-dependent atpase ris1 [Diplodia corticola]OJD31053.1 swi snf family dna-dependent atpase ris1 [Diplodia corticola]
MEHLSKKEKKKRRRQANRPETWSVTPREEPEPAPAAPELPVPEDDRPDTSPYTSATMALRFGTEGIQYNVPAALLPSSINTDPEYYDYTRTICLSDIDSDIAHPLVHFLHTGKYETLRSGEASLVARDIREHQRALNLYVTASKYGLRELQILAMEKIRSIKPGVPAGDILEHLEAVMSDTSDEDEFLEAYLTDTLKKTFAELANLSGKVPRIKLSSRFARAMVVSFAAILDDMQASVSEKDKTRNTGESFHMPAPPEEPPVEADCLSLSGTAKSEGLTHDSFSVVSYDTKEGTSSDHRQHDSDAFSANIPYDGPELEQCKKGAQPLEEADAGKLQEPDDEEDWVPVSTAKKDKKKKKKTRSAIK